jgi:hypothetical protein
MSPYHFESFACLEFVAFRSRWISFVECSRLSFFLLLFLSICVQVRMLLLLLMMLMRAVSGRSRPMRARFPTGTRMHRSSEGDHSLLGWRMCAWRERNHFRKTLFYLLKCSFGFKSLYHNTWYTNCNNYFITWISRYCMLTCFICAFSLHQESHDMILGDEPLISKVVLSQWACAQNSVYIYIVAWRIGSTYSIAWNATYFAC